MTWIVKLVERSCCAKTLMMCCRIVKLVERKRSEETLWGREKRRMNEGQLTRRWGYLGWGGDAKWHGCALEGNGKRRPTVWEDTLLSDKRQDYVDSEPRLNAWTFSPSLHWTATDFSSMQRTSSGIWQVCANWADNRFDVKAELQRFGMVFGQYDRHQGKASGSMVSVVTVPSQRLILREAMYGVLLQSKLEGNEVRYDNGRATTTTIINQVYHLMGHLV